MYGGVRIEGTSVTFYKNVTTINTSMELETAKAAIAELGMDELEYQQLQEMVLAGPMQSTVSERFQPMLAKLKEQGYIGEDPLKHWGKNNVVCKLDIINPDITINDKGLKHITPRMKEQFDKHVNALLKLGVIRPSTSRHRTMAFIVESGTTVDPVTGEEKRGKERMVFNYKTLNDNTHKDQYSLPGISTILKMVGNSKIYSKFDLKSGFHQVLMA